MSFRTTSLAIRTIVAFVVAVGLLLGPLRTLAAHDPISLAVAEAQRHAELATEWQDHGHSHDDGSEDEQSIGHTHGHNPGDHSHETPDEPPSFFAAFPMMRDGWQAVTVKLPAPQASPDFQRPPRSIFVA